MSELVVIVTGGSRGAGRRITRVLAGAGHAVVVVYLDGRRAAETAVEEALAAGGAALAIRADVTDELDVERLFDETIAAFGRVDLVIGAAACNHSVLARHAAR